jgi:hypothetical protein
MGRMYENIMPKAAREIMVLKVVVEPIFIRDRSMHTMLIIKREFSGILRVGWTY